MVALLGVCALAPALNLLVPADSVFHLSDYLVGLLGKILGPIGFVDAVWRGVFPLAFGVNILTNDLIWWVPFGLILLRAWRQAAGEEERG